MDQHLPTWALTYLSSSLFILLNSFRLMSYNVVEIWKFYERLCLHFNLLGSLLFLRDEPDQRQFTAFSNHFERPNLSENIIFYLLMSTSYLGYSDSFLFFIFLIFSHWQNEKETQATMERRLVSLNKAWITK